MPQVKNIPYEKEKRTDNILQNRRKFQMCEWDIFRGERFFFAFLLVRIKVYQHKIKIHVHQKVIF